jgi:hypothetical protein
MKKKIAGIYYAIMGSGFLKIGVILVVMAGIFYGIDEFMWSKKADWGETAVLKTWYPVTKWYRDLLGFPTE